MHFQRLVLIFLISFGIPFGLSAQNSDTQDLLNKVNAVRKAGCQCGKKYMPPAPPLLWDNKLENAALRHSKDMFLNKNYRHSGTDRSTPDSRISDAGFDWEGVSENIAWGYSTFDEALRSWIKSERHCKNLMDPFYTHIGISRFKGCWVQDFGKPIHYKP